MSILINKDSRVMVSGITGKEGTFHTERMMETGTNIVCGVTPGKGGIEHLGVPVYNSVKEAVENHEIDACGIFVPARFARAAVDEAVDAGVKFVVVITEGICPHDTLKFLSNARNKGARVLGPNTPGLLTPDESKIGVLATDLVEKGRVGVVSRSGTLTVEICYYLLKEGYGQSSIIGLGGDPVVGTSFTDVYKLFEEDPETDAVVIVGEIGGTMEEDLAEYIIKNGGKKPAVAFIAGQNAPGGKRMGHAGAIIEGGRGSADSKIEALTKAGVKVARVPWETGKFVKEILN
ncbi:MAG: succinate--CoA ligase subunit alpha [Elusimicrobia bacterium]|nr:succinate--CoA ligase subunit alpha [Elusimicrobiota bacterium]